MPAFLEPLVGAARWSYLVSPFLSLFPPLDMTTIEAGSAHSTGLASLIQSDPLGGQVSIHRGSSRDIPLIPSAPSIQGLTPWAVPRINLEAQHSEQT